MKTQKSPSREPQQSVRLQTVARWSGARRGVLKINPQNPPAREPQQSVRLKTVTELMAADAPRSTCHQALRSWLVAVTEPSVKVPSVLPSTADAAPAVRYPGSVLL